MESLSYRLCSRNRHGVTIALNLLKTLTSMGCLVREGCKVIRLVFKCEPAVTWPARFYLNVSVLVGGRTCALMVRFALLVVGCLERHHFGLGPLSG